MKTRKNLTLLLLLGGLASGLLGAQMNTNSTGEKPRAARAVAGLKVEYGGFNADGRAQYLVTVRLQPIVNPDGSRASFLVRLRDEEPPIIDVIGENTERKIQADPDHPSEHTFLLSAAWFHRGPQFVEVLECGAYGLCRVEGPLQLARMGSGLTPYGALGTGKDRISLHAIGNTAEGSIISLKLYNVPAGYPGVLAVAPTPHREKLLGGTLLIGPGWIFPMLIPASDNTSREQSFDAMVAPWMKGIRFYLQAAFGRFEEDGSLFLRFSNAVEIAVPAYRNPPGNPNGNPNGTVMTPGDEDERKPDRP